MMLSMLRFLLSALLAALAAAGPINETCPVSGEKADGKVTSELKFGFCCANCKGRFDRDPLATLQKLDRIPVDTCPLSGKAAGDATSTVVVAFCRQDCKSTFDKDPGKYLAKIQAAEKR
jgi:YHS domain-containing protein